MGKIVLISQSLQCLRVINPFISLLFILNLSNFLLTCRLSFILMQEVTRPTHYI
jgi:hypothetical protein